MMKKILILFLLIININTYSQKENYKLRKRADYIELIVDGKRVDSFYEFSNIKSKRHTYIKIKGNHIISSGIIVPNVGNIEAAYIRLIIFEVKNNKFIGRILKVYSKCIYRKLKFSFKDEEIICKYKKNFFCKAKILRTIKYSEIEKLKEITLSCK